MIDPCLTLFRNKRTFDFVVLNLCVDPEFGFCVAYGPLIQIADEKMRTSAVDVLLFNLQGFDRRKPDAAEFNALSSKDRESFAREFLEMGVSLREGGKSIRFEPMRRGTRGGHVGEPDDMVSVSITADKDIIYDQLVMAFAACTK